MNCNRRKLTRSALVFEMKIRKIIKAYLHGKIKTSGYWAKGGPISTKQVSMPKLVSENWILVKVVYCGICGSDMKELTLNGARDNPIRSFISFPQILGHEAVGIIEKVGKNVRKFKIGDRVAVNPWFPCSARGINPECLRCQTGDYPHCKNFRRGNLPIGMHLGTTKGYGGFTTDISVHESQCFLIPGNVSFEQAVLADPFAVAFHSVLLLDPIQESTILVYGLGVIGLLVVMVLINLFRIKNVLAIGRYQFQKDLALKLGARHVFISKGENLIVEITDYLNIETLKPDKGLIWAMDGVDGIIDTIASAETLEFGMKILITQGKLIFLGVSTPKRYESTLHYFKELEITGSNAYSIEHFEGKRAHAFEFFMKFLEAKRIDPSILVTHKYPIEEYKKAFDTLSNKSKSCAVKVIFDFLNKI